MQCACCPAAGRDRIVAIAKAVNYLIDVFFHKSHDVQRALSRVLSYYPAVPTIKPGAFLVETCFSTRAA